MEFFEKAHVVSKNPSEEVLKKRQLKQMLQGYKQNDNDVIKTSANKKLQPDETFSMSSFSEADFINTSVENDSGPESPCAVASDAEDTTISENDETKEIISLSSFENIESLGSKPVDELAVSHPEQQISLHLKEDPIWSDHSMSSDYEGIEGFSSDSTSDETKSEDSQPLDPDGSLANMIKQRLGKRESPIEQQRITKKVKLSKPKTADANWSVEDMPLISSTIDSKSSSDTKTKLTTNTDSNSQGKDEQSRQKVGKAETPIDLPRKKKAKPKKPIIKHEKDSWIVEDMSRIQISEDECDKHLPSSNKSSSSEESSSSGGSSSSESSSSSGCCSSSGESSSSDSESNMETSTTDSNSHADDELAQNNDPFVSMQAPEFICGSLGDILSEYSVATTKVLPCEHRAVPVTGSKIFTSEIVDTGLRGSDEECEHFVEQFNIEGDGSVIDETEMVVDDNLVVEPTNTEGDLSVVDETGITIDDNLVDEPTKADYPVVNETEVPEETSSDDEPYYCSEIDSSSESSCGDNTETPSEQKKNISDEKVKIYYKKLQIRSESCILVMQHPAEIYIHGKVRVTALGGTAEILGFTLNDAAKSYDVFAPHHSHAQYLRTVEANNNNYGLFGRLTSSGLTVPEAEDIVVNLKHNDVVLNLEKLNSRKIDFVENNFTTSNLFGKTSKYYDKFFTKASAILCCSLYLKAPLKCFEENPVWGDIIQNIDNHSKGIIAGGKGAGKSTFLRYCTNKLLGRGPVLVLDLDPGQSEFTPAGNVSVTLVTEPLLGPNYTHLRTPDEMLNVGVINVMENLSRYTNAVDSLITLCAREPRYQNIPWLVNTMGLCNTVGFKIMTLNILLLRPTFLLQIYSRTAKKNYDIKLDPQAIKSLYVEQYQRNSLFRSVACKELDYSFFFTEQRGEGAFRSHSLAPRDERYLNFLAYFGELLEQHEDLQFLEIVPYKVPLEKFRIGSNVKFEEEAITKVINGKIVALCEDEGGDSRDKLFTLADKPLRCHGYGLVRGVEGAVLYVCTGAARAQLARVTTLVYADWAPELRPERAAGLAPGAALPYRTASEDEHKKFMFTPRRRFNPLKFLKMAKIS